MELRWGDPDLILELMRKTAYREGFGNILAEGCARAADIVGRDSEYYAMHIKNRIYMNRCVVPWPGVWARRRPRGAAATPPVLRTVKEARLWTLKK